MARQLFLFLLVVVEKRLWFGSHMHLVLAPTTVVKGDNEENLLLVYSHMHYCLIVLYKCIGLVYCELQEYLH